MKSIAILTLLFQLIIGNLLAQTGWSWAHSISGNCYSGTITTDASGNSYIAGTFKGASINIGGIVLPISSANNRDIFVAKYAPSGNIIWAKSIVGNADTYAPQITSMVLDQSGHLYLLGAFSDYLSMGNIVLSNYDHLGYTDVFVAKCDTELNVIWAKKGTGPGFDSEAQGLMDSQGNLYVYGNFEGGSITFDSTIININTGASSDAYIVKFSPTGAIQWAKDIGATGRTYIRGLDFDHNDNLYITGGFECPSLVLDTCTLVGDNSGIGTAFFAKYNSLGNIIWAKTANGNSVDFGNSIVTDPNGGFYFSMESISPTLSIGDTTIIQAHGRSFDFILSKFDSLGNLVWVKQQGGTNDDFGFIKKVDANGDFYVYGYYLSDTLILGTTVMTNDSVPLSNAFVAKYNAQGQVIWAQSIEGKYRELVEIDFSSNHNIYATGYFTSSTVKFGNITLTNSTPDNTNSNAFFAKIGDGFSGIDFQKESNSQVMVYPNPNNGTLYFKGLNRGYNVGIYNMFGNLVTSSVVNTDNFQVNIDGASKGMYIYRITNDGLIIKQGKVIVQ